MTALFLVLALSVASATASTPGIEGSCGTDASTRSPFAGGNGTAEQPYGICTLTQLSHMEQEKNPKAFYQLWSDIDASATQKSPEGFTPLFSTTQPFEGSLDGLNHSITGLSMIRPSEDYVGLFRFCQECKIDHLQLKDVQITGKHEVGALIGHYIVDSEWKGHTQLPEMTQIFVSGTVSGEGESSAGGVFGYVYDLAPLLSDSDFEKLGVTFRGRVIDLRTNSGSRKISGIYDYD